MLCSFDMECHRQNPIYLHSRAEQNGRDVNNRGMKNEFFWNIKNYAWNVLSGLKIRLNSMKGNIFCYSGILLLKDYEHSMDKKGHSA